MRYKVAVDANTVASYLYSVIGLLTYRATRKRVARYGDQLRQMLSPFLGHGAPLLFRSVLPLPPLFHSELEVYLREGVIGPEHATLLWSFNELVGWRSLLKLLLKALCIPLTPCGALAIAGLVGLVPRARPLEACALACAGTVVAGKLFLWVSQQ